jgi:hypothetical protein
MPSECNQKEQKLALGGTWKCKPKVLFASGDWRDWTYIYVVYIILGMSGYVCM